MNKIDKIAKRKELLENGYSFDFKRSIDENGDPIVIAKPIFFKETDYHLRVPHAKF